VSDIEYDDGRVAADGSAPLAPRRVLVTGAAGNLGGAVRDELTAHGIQVVAVDRTPGQGITQVDLRDLDAVRAAARGCDAAIHLAAYPAPGIVADNDLFTNNTLATFHVLTAAAEQGMAAVVIASSISAYGMTFAHRPFSPRYVPIDEDHPMTPQDAYGLSKVIDEQTALMMTRAHPMSVVALRFHWVTDPGRARDRARRLNSTSDHPVSVRELWSYIDRRDAAAACRRALAVRDGFHALNICAADTLSDTPTSELLARHHPETEIRADLDPHRSPWSTDRAREVFGFVPRWTWRSTEPLEVPTR
jgi:nucleoside-diphosphate-sugar epimerase